MLIPMALAAHNQSILLIRKILTVKTTYSAKK